MEFARRFGSSGKRPRAPAHVRPDSRRYCRESMVDNARAAQAQYGRIAAPIWPDVSHAVEGCRPVQTDDVLQSKTGEDTSIAGFVDFARRDRQMSGGTERGYKPSRRGKSRSTECRIWIKP